MSVIWFAVTRKLLIWFLNNKVFLSSIFIRLFDTMIIICISTGLPELLSQQGQFLFFLIRTDKIPINDETCDWILDFLKGIYLQIMPVTSSPLSPTTVQLSAFDCQQLRRHRFLTPAAILTCLHVSGMSVKLWLNSLAGRPPRSTTSTPPWSPSNPHKQVSSFQWPWSAGMNLSCACMWRRGWLQICEMDTNEFHFYHLPAPVFRAQQEQHLGN